MVYRARRPSSSWLILPDVLKLLWESRALDAPPLVGRGVHVRPGRGVCDLPAAGQRPGPEGPADRRLAGRNPGPSYSLANYDLYRALSIILGIVCGVLLAAWVPHYLTWPWSRDEDTFSVLAMSWDRGVPAIPRHPGLQLPG